MSDMSVFSTVMLVLGTIGNSLKDQVNKIEKGQTELKAEMGIIKDILLGTSAKPKKVRLKKVE